MEKKSKEEKAPESNKKPEQKDKKCDDKNCPIHGVLKVRGRTFTEKVVKVKSRRTAMIQIERRNYIPKYERYERKRKRLQVHNPDCINAKEGDLVKVVECRPLSKTKHFVIIEKV